MTEGGIKENLYDFTIFLGHQFFSVTIFIIKIDDEGLDGCGEVQQQVDCDHQCRGY